jgi:hypothetical protein
MRVDGSDPPIRSVPHPLVAELAGLVSEESLACLSRVVWPLPYLGAAVPSVASDPALWDPRPSGSMVAGCLDLLGWLGHFWGAVGSL